MVLEYDVVPEIVRLVDDDQIVIAPIDAVEWRAERFTAGAEQVRVTEHIVIEAVAGKDVRSEIAVVIEPVVGQLLGAKHKYGAIPKLVVLDDGQSGECLSQSDAVGKNTAVVGFELVDDAGGGITLEVVELFPNEAVLVPSQVVRKYVL